MEMNKKAYLKYKSSALYQQNSKKKTTPLYIDLKIQEVSSDYIRWSLTLKSLDEMTGEWASLGAISRAMDSDFLYVILSLKFYDKNNHIIKESNTLKRKIYKFKRNTINETSFFSKDFSFERVTVSIDLDTKIEHYHNQDTFLEEENKIKIKNKILLFCDLQAQEFISSKTLYEHELNRCKKDLFSRNLSVEEIDNIILEDNKRRKRLEKIKILKKNRLKVSNDNVKEIRKSEINRQKRSQPVNVIKRFCSDKWGIDYRMVKYCVNEQLKAKKYLDSTYISSEIKRFCSDKWGSDYRMVKYCVKQQKKAKEALY